MAILDPNELSLLAFSSTDVITLWRESYRARQLNPTLIKTESDVREHIVVEGTDTYDRRSSYDRVEARNTYSRINHTDTYTQIGARNTYDRVTGENTYTRVTARDSYDRVIARDSYDRVAAVNLYERTAAVNLYTQIAGRNTYDRVEARNIYDRVEARNTYTEVAARNIYSQTPTRDTYTQVAARNTYTQVAHVNTYTEVAERNYYDRVTAVNTYTQVAARDTYTQVAARNYYDRVIEHNTYTQVAERNYYDRVTAVNVYTQVAARDYYDRVAAVNTYTQVAARDTYTQVAARNYYDRVEARDYYDRVAARNSYTQSAARDTYTRVDARDSYSQSAAQNTYTQNPGYTQNVYTQNPAYTQNAYTQNPAYTQSVYSRAGATYNKYAQSTAGATYNKYAQSTAGATYSQYAQSTAGSAANYYASGYYQYLTRDYGETTRYYTYYSKAVYYYRVAYTRTAAYTARGHGYVRRAVSYTRYYYQYSYTANYERFAYTRTEYTRTYGGNTYYYYYQSPTYTQNAYTQTPAYTQNAYTQNPAYTQNAYTQNPSYTQYTQSTAGSTYNRYAQSTAGATYNKYAQSTAGATYNKYAQAAAGATQNTYTRVAHTNTYDQAAAGATQNIYDRVTAVNVYTQVAARNAYDRVEARNYYDRVTAVNTYTQVAARNTYDRVEARNTYNQVAAVNVYTQVAARNTYDRVSPVNSYTQIAERNTYDRVAAVNTYNQVAARNTYTQVAPRNTYSQTASRDSYDRVTGQNSYDRVAHVNIYTEVAARNTYDRVTAVNTYTQIAQRDTYTQVAERNTYDRVAHTDTYSQVAQRNTYTQVAPVNTYTQVAARDSYTQVAARNTYTQVAAQDTYSRVAAENTYTQVAGRNTYTQANTYDRTIIETISKGFDHENYVPTKPEIVDGSAKSIEGAVISENLELRLASYDANSEGMGTTDDFIDLADGTRVAYDSTKVLYNIKMRKIATIGGDAFTGEWITLAAGSETDSFNVDTTAYEDGQYELVITAYNPAISALDVTQEYVSEENTYVFTILNTKLGSDITVVNANEFHSFIYGLETFRNASGIVGSYDTTKLYANSSNQRGLFVEFSLKDEDINTYHTAKAELRRGNNGTVVCSAKDVTFYQGNVTGDKTGYVFFPLDDMLDNGCFAELNVILTVEEFNDATHTQRCAEKYRTLAITQAETVVYVGVDNTRPTISISAPNTMKTNEQKVSFVFLDQSGLGLHSTYVQAVLKGGSPTDSGWVEVDENYELFLRTPGEYAVYGKAIDMAGNETIMSKGLGNDESDPTYKVYYFNEEVKVRKKVAWEQTLKPIITVSTNMDMDGCLVELEGAIGKQSATLVSQKHIGFDINEYVYEIEMPIVTGLAPGSYNLNIYYSIDGGDVRPTSIPIKVVKEMEYESIKMKISHTEQWEKNRQTYNASVSAEKQRAENVFWAGEAFVIDVETRVKVPEALESCFLNRVYIKDENGPIYKTNGDLYEYDFAVAILTGAYTYKDGVITQRVKFFSDDMAFKWGGNEPKELTFVFEYADDVEEEYTVIVDNTAEFFKFHRRK